MYILSIRCREFAKRAPCLITVVMFQSWWSKPKRKERKMCIFGKEGQGNPRCLRDTCVADKFYPRKTTTHNEQFAVQFHRTGAALYSAPPSRPWCMPPHRLPAPGALTGDASLEAAAVDVPSPGLGTGRGFWAQVSPLFNWADRTMSNPTAGSHVLRPNIFMDGRVEGSHHISWVFLAVLFLCFFLGPMKVTIPGNGPLLGEVFASVVRGVGVCTKLLGVLSDQIFHPPMLSALLPDRSNAFFFEKAPKKLSGVKWEAVTGSRCHPRSCHFPRKLSGGFGKVSGGRVRPK